MVKTINGTPIVSALKGALFSVLCSVTLILITARLLTESSSLELMIAIAPKIIQLVSAFIGGIIAGIRAEGNGYVSGGICGIIYGGIIFVASMLSNGYSFFYSLIQLLIIISVATLGGTISSSKTKSEKKRRKAMMKKLRNN